MKAYVSYTILLTIEDVKSYEDALEEAQNYASENGFSLVVNDMEIELLDD